MKEKALDRTIILTTLVAIVFAGAGFFGGMRYQQMQRGRNQQFAFGQGGTMPFRANFGSGQRSMMMGGAVIGDVASLDDKSLTVKLPDGSSKIVLFSDSTTISKTDTAQKTDLKVGDKVGVFGTTNSDGSVTAQNIQLNPMFGRAMMGGATPSPSPAR